MAARHVGRRIGTVSSSIGRRKGGGGVPGCAAQGPAGKTGNSDSGERRHLIQLVACGSIFVLLVAVKLCCRDAWPR